MNRPWVLSTILATAILLVSCGGGGSPQPPQPPPPPPPPPGFRITTSAPGFRITTSALPGGVAGVPYSFKLEAAGGAEPYTWTVDPRVSWAMSLSPDGVLSGVHPVSQGGLNYGGISITATDSATPPKTASQFFTLDMLGFRPNTAPTPQAGEQYSAAFFAWGGVEPIQWGMNGSIPPGLSLIKRTDVAGTRDFALTGVPTAAGHYDFAVTITDSGVPSRSQTINFNIDVQPRKLVLANLRLPPAVVGQAYSYTLPKEGGAAPYQWAFTVTTPLPPGLALDEVNGGITGTPTAAGYASFTAGVTDSSSPSVQIAIADYWLLTTTAQLPNRNDSIATATPIFVGNYDLSISPLGDPIGATSPDQDYFKLTAPAGQSFHISVQGHGWQRTNGFKFSNLDPVVEIVDANGHPFATCSDPLDDIVTELPITPDSTPGRFDDVCMNYGGDGSFSGYERVAWLNFRTPASSGIITFYVHVFDYWGDARPDMFYRLAVEKF
jgi:hypothetical protein